MNNKATVKDALLRIVKENPEASGKQLVAIAKAEKIKTTVGYANQVKAAWLKTQPTPHQRINKLIDGIDGFFKSQVQPIFDDVEKRLSELTDRLNWLESMAIKREHYAFNKETDQWEFVPSGLPSETPKPRRTLWQRLFGAKS